LQVLQGLDDLLQRQKLQLQAEEAQQLRHFRSKLSEIEGQMQADKQVAAAHQDSWMAKTVCAASYKQHCHPWQCPALSTPQFLLP
jgi:DNA-binding transcriptional regulator YbjK